MAQACNLFVDNFLPLVDTEGILHAGTQCSTPGCTLAIGAHPQRPAAAGKYQQIFDSYFII